VSIFHFVIALITCMLWFFIYSHPSILFYNCFDYLYALIFHLQPPYHILKLFCKWLIVYRLIIMQLLWLSCNSFDYLENKINCFASDILFMLWLSCNCFDYLVIALITWRIKLIALQVINCLCFDYLENKINCFASDLLFMLWLSCNCFDYLVIALITWRIKLIVLQVISCLCFDYLVIALIIL
jgi:hypothetical protein